MQLTFGAVRDPGSAWTRLLDSIRDAATVITHKELAYALNVQPSYLSEALAPVDQRIKNRKGVRAEWLPTILAMAPVPAQLGILTELAVPVGYDVIRRKERTPEERLAALEQRIASEFGVVGARLVEESRR